MRDEKQCAWPGCDRLTPPKRKHCDICEKLARAAANKRYVERNREKVKKLNREWRKKYGNNTVPTTTQIPDRGKTITVHRWEISEVTYGVLVATYGKQWAESHCAALAARGRAA